MKTDFEKFLAREAMKARIRRDILPAIGLLTMLSVAFLLGRCAA